MRINDLSIRERKRFSSDTSRLRNSAQRHSIILLDANLSAR